MPGLLRNLKGENKMNKPMIGINGLVGTKPDKLEESIKKIIEFGFDGMEFCLSSVPLIAEGEILEKYAAYVQDIFSRYPLKYTAHIGTGLDLRNLQDYSLHKKVLMSSIELCARLGMDRLTLHFENESLIQKEEQAFYDAHIEAIEFAASKGVLLLMENIEVEDYRKVIAMVGCINHENFKMTLDVGHLNLSVNYFGGDFKDAVRECAPYVKHVHMNDNTGRFEKMRLGNFALYKTLPMGMRTAFGAGDIHLPPLWGKIPMKWVVETLHNEGFDGIFICEYENDLYVPFGRQIQEDMRSMVNEIYNS